MPHAACERSMTGLGIRTTRLEKAGLERAGLEKTDPGATGIRRGRGARFVAALLCLGAAVGLGACSVPVADLPVIGLPAGAPTRPTGPTAYPAVHDMPGDRTDQVLDPAEQAKLSNDLKAVRDRQEGAVKASEKAANQ